MKLMIIGKGPSKEFAPKDFDGEVWGLNDLKSDHKFTRWFELHKQWDAKFLASLDIPVYMQDHNPEIPKSVPYPIERITRKLGRYFTNTVSYMLALALDEGFKTVVLYGVDMHTQDERARQRGSVEYFLGVARGMGVEVHVSHGSSLLQSKLYGYEV